MTPIIQQDRTGCGIASVAGLAGVSYQEAKHATTSIGISIEDKALWSETTYVRSLLSYYGVKAQPLLWFYVAVE